MRLLAVVAVAGLWWGLVATAQPAVAHVGGGPEPANYRVQLRGLHPPTPGVAVRVGTGGQWVRIANQGAETVTVQGYAGEPFLRLAAGRIRVNLHSTALADNPELATVSADARRKAKPRWVTVGEGTSVTWSDARVDPEEATRPGGADAVREWQLPIRVDGHRVTAVGTGTRVLPPSPWPWAAATVVAGLAAAALGWLRRWHAAVSGALILAGAATAAHLAGVAAVPRPGSVAAAWAASLGPGLLCWLLVALGVAAAVRRSEHAAFVTAVAGAVTAVLSVGDVGVFWHSQLPFAGPAPVQRGLVALTVGLGAGLAVAGVRLLPHASAPDPPLGAAPDTAGGTSP